MNWRLTAYILIIAIVLLAASLSFLYYLYNNLYDRHARILDAYGSVLLQLNKCRADLSKEKQALLSLNNQYNKLFSDYNSLLEENKRLRNQSLSLQEQLINREARLKNLTTEFNKILSVIENIQDQLNDSFKWFRSNDVFPKSSPYYAALSYCFEKSKLNVACVSSIWEKKDYFTYKLEENDTLYDVLTSLRKKGGDCEDYAFVMKALIHTLRPSKLLLWKPSKGSEFDLYEDSAYRYYLPDAEAVSISLDGKHIDVVCYLTEKRGDSYIGHCVDAVVDGDPPFSGELFEPQDGQYLGKIGSYIDICRDGEVGCEDELGKIYLIISEDQLYTFENGTWYSYHSIYDKLAHISDEIAQALAEPS